MLKPLRRIFAPRTRWQFVASYLTYSTLFEVVFFAVAGVFGVFSVVPLWKLVMIGWISVAPFVTLSLLMLKFQIKLQRKLRMTARTDMLTRLPNRRAFIEAIEAELPHRDGILMMVDVDHFKRVNDTYGHGFGDFCLIQTAQMLRPVMPRGYLLARLGGEEFGIMMFDGQLEQVKHIASRIARGIEVETPETGVNAMITNSVGITLAHAGEDLSDILNRADHALYDAKTNGRGRYELSHEDRNIDVASIKERLAS